MLICPPPANVVVVVVEPGLIVEVVTAGPPVVAAPPSFTQAADTSASAQTMMDRRLTNLSDLTMRIEAHGIQGRRSDIRWSAWRAGFRTARKQLTYLIDPSCDRG
jgi:hypothetical protein